MRAKNRKRVQPVRRLVASRPHWTLSLDKACAVCAGTEILRQDSAPEDVFLIDDGIVQLVRVDDTQTPALVGLRFPGWFLGAESAIAGALTPVSARALTACQLVRVSRRIFLDLLRTQPDLSWRINQMHAREVFDRMRSSERSASPVDRLKTLLTQLVEANDATAIEKQISLRLPVVDAQLAQLISVSSREVRRLFARLERERLIRVNDDVVTILHPRRLSQAHVNDIGWPINARLRGREVEGE